MANLKVVELLAPGENYDGAKVVCVHGKPRSWARPTFADKFAASIKSDTVEPTVIFAWKRWYVRIETPDGKLSRLLDECGEDFGNQLVELARKHNKAPLFVFRLWREYCRDCRNGDQCPDWEEFQEWYKNQLSA